MIVYPVIKCKVVSTFLSFYLYCYIFMTLKECEKFSKNKSICPKEGVMNNGKEALRGEAPYMAIIEAKKNDTFVHQCGGALVHNKYVLSAAHCVLQARDENTPEFKYFVRLGVHNRTESDKSKRYEVMENFTYNYKGITNTNDIILLLLNETVKYTENIKPACLPSPEDPIKPSDHIYLYGFGGKKNNIHAVSDVLLKGRMKVIPTEGSIRKMDTIIVTGYEKRNDACQGDSGGPLIRQHQYYGPCLAEVMAVVSEGTDCGAIASQTNYTNVLRYLPWITKVVWNVSETHEKEPPKPTFRISVNPNKVNNEYECYIHEN